MGGANHVDVSPVAVRLPDGPVLHAEVRTVRPGPRADGSAGVDGSGTTAPDAVPGPGKPGTAPGEPGPGPGTGTGLSVVFLHGWTLDHRLWRRQLADLPARLSADPGVPLRLLAFDLRGHGRSSPAAAGSATLAQLADDLLMMLHRLTGTDRVVLVGHSLGGMTVVEYAHRHRADFLARVAGVVLVSTSAEGALHTTYGLPPTLAKVVRAVELGSTDLLARFGTWHPHRMVMPALSPAVRWLVFGTSVDRRSLQLVTDMVGRASLRSLGAFRPAIERHRRLDALAAMRDIPVTVLVGSLDRLTPVPCGQSIVTEVAHATLRVVDGAGHMLPMERPGVVTDAVARVCVQAVDVDRRVPDAADVDRRVPDASGEAVLGTPVAGPPASDHDVCL